MKSKFRPMALLVIPVLLVTMACGLLSSTSSGSSSSGSSSSSGGNEVNGGNPGSPSTYNQVILKDDFSDNTSGWGIANDANKVVQYTQGTLEFQVIKPNDFVYSTPSDTAYSNVHIEVTVKPNASDANSAFGVLCDQQTTSEDFYYFAITPNGQYAIALAATGKQDVFLTNNDKWGTSTLIPTNASSYKVTVECSNGVLNLYVNDKMIDTASDSTYTSGMVGLFAWSGKAASSADMSFDNFSMTSLK